VNNTLPILLLFLCVQSHSQVLNSKFDSKNHPKAKGVWVTVRYPTGWEAKEGERPNIVQKFIGDYNGMFVMLSLQILNAGAPVEKECSELTARDFTDVFTEKESNTYASDAKKIKHEEKPAFLYALTSRVERSGNVVDTYSKVMTICYKNMMISAWCSPSTIDVKNQAIFSSKKHLEAAAPLCLQYFNSLVLMDKY